MSPKQAQTFFLNEAPITGVNYSLGEKNSTFRVSNQLIPELKKGQILVKTLYLSNDPSQRAYIQKGVDPERTYAEPVLPGQKMTALGLGEIVALSSKKYSVGQKVTCNLFWQDYCTVNESAVLSVVPDIGLPLTTFLDVLGLTGLTAYFGLFEVANLKPTDTIIVSAALGATGSMCIQLAKNVIGCKKVIGISGSPDKCKFVESLGADKCVNYNDRDFKNQLKSALGEDKYCDVFFDGVGGRILDKVMTVVKQHGTVVACGAIAGYEDVRKGAVYNWGEIILNRLQVKGFIVLDFAEQFSKAVKDISVWVKEGKIKTDNSSLTVVDLNTIGGFTKIPETWGLLFNPKKAPGKLLTKL